MSRLVELSDIEPSTPQTVTVGATAVTLSEKRLGKTKRSFFSIVPITAGVTVTIVFGEGTAAVNAGLPLQAGQPFIQSLDINGRGVYQGDIQAIASGPGSVAFVEIFEP